MNSDSYTKEDIPHYSLEKKDYIAFLNVFSLGLCGLFVCGAQIPSTNINSKYKHLCEEIKKMLINNRMGSILLRG